VQSFLIILLPPISFNMDSRTYSIRAKQVAVLHRRDDDLFHEYSDLPIGSPIHLMVGRPRLESPPPSPSPAGKVAVGTTTKSDAVIGSPEANRDGSTPEDKDQGDEKRSVVTAIDQDTIDGTKPALSPEWDIIDADDTRGSCEESVATASTLSSGHGNVASGSHAAEIPVTPRRSKRGSADMGVEEAAEQPIKKSRVMKPAA
jgi:hypothetical protein